jgi:hydroxymethylpyrimidine/phosphomethylpyrimidine kinase
MKEDISFFVWTNCKTIRLNLHLTQSAAVIKNQIQRIMKDLPMHFWKHGMLHMRETVICITQGHDLAGD